MEISREAMKAVIAAIRSGAASLVEATGDSSTLLKLTPGTEVKAEVLARQDNGRFLVRVSGGLMDMPLPANTQVGGSLKMTYLGDQPRPTFAFSSQQIKGADVNISGAGRWLGSLSSLTQNPSAAQKSAPASATLFDALPQDKAAIAVRLKEMVARSGLFYESHLERWSNNSYPLKELLKEPQGQRSPLLTRPELPQAEFEQVPTAKGGADTATIPTKPDNAVSTKQESGALVLTSRDKLQEGGTPAPRPALPASSADAPEQETAAAGSTKQAVPASGASLNNTMNKGEIQAAAPETPQQRLQSAGSGVRLPEQQAEMAQKPPSPLLKAPEESIQQKLSDRSAGQISPPQDPAGKPAKGELLATGPVPLQAAVSSGEKQPVTPQTRTGEQLQRGMTQTQTQLPTLESSTVTVSARQVVGAPVTMATDQSPEADIARQSQGSQPSSQPQTGDAAPQNAAEPKVRMARQPAGQTVAQSLTTGSPEITKPETMTSSSKEAQAQASRQATSQFEPDSQTLPVIRQQLDFLNTGQFVWQGEAWQGRRMEWAIRRDRRNAQASMERSWQSELRLELPNLGTINAAITVTGTQVRLSLSTSEQECSELMERHRQRLVEGIESGGLTLSGMEVKHEPSA